MTSVVLLIVIGARGRLPGDRSSNHPSLAKPPLRPPNVLIVMTDDQRAQGTMQVLPRTRAWLEANGVTFSNAYSTTPLCCPARASVFSGRYAHNHGVTSNFDATPLDQSQTIQALLQRRGYQTAMVGKYFNRWDPQVDPPHFDHWAITRYGYYGAVFNVDGTTAAIPEYATSFIADKAGVYLDDFEGADETPWLMFVTPTAPHAPYSAPRTNAITPPGRWNPNPAIFEDDTSDKPAFVTRLRSGRARSKQLRDAQLVALAPVDKLVAGLKKKLETLDEIQNTLVIFMSDQGYMWGEHHREGKRLPYLQAGHIPLLASWPEHLDAGIIDERLVANIDIAPTIADAAGVHRDKDRWDGLSILDSTERESLLLEYFKDPRRGVLPGWRSLVTEQYQYIEYFDEGDQTIFREYYDLEKDPWELNNLAGRDLETRLDLRSLRQALRDLMVCFGDSCLR